MRPAAASIWLTSLSELSTVAKKIFIRVNGMEVFFATVGDSLGDVNQIEAAAGRIFAA